MKCKVFTVNKKILEHEVNEWLQSDEVKKFNITNITQTESTDIGYITLTIFYEELKEVRKRKLDKLNKK